MRFPQRRSLLLIQSGGDSYMSVTGGLKKKIKGQVEQLKGEINQAQGKDAKGGLQKVTGKVQEKMGDLEFNNSRRTT